MSGIPDLKVKMDSLFVSFGTLHNVWYPRQIAELGHATDCFYHVVFCPKYRRKVLVGEVELRLKELITQACTERSIDIIEMEIMPDHVHLLLEVDPQYGIHRAVKLIKGASSRALRTEFKHLTTKLPTLWTNSYFVSTVGGAPLEAIKQYVQNQKTSERK